MIKKVALILFAFLLPIIALANTSFASGYTPEVLLYQGMQNSSVTELQRDLKSLGYFYYTPTGYFGIRTTQSVKAYQSNHNLVTDGIVGHKTGKEIEIDMILQESKNYIGVPYAWGGTSPSGFDCSGFTQYVFNRNGITLPRTVGLQFGEGYWVSRNQLHPGDLVFFSTYKPGASHVGIYMGNNRFIHASSSQGVTVTDMNNSYFSQRYIGANRIIV